VEGKTKEKEVEGTKQKEVEGTKGKEVKGNTNEKEVKGKTRSAQSGKSSRKPLKTITKVNEEPLPADTLKKFHNQLKKTSGSVILTSKGPNTRSRSSDTESDDFQEYVPGKPLLPSLELASVPWEMQKLHEWYLKASLRGIDCISAVVQEEVFLSPLFHLSFFFEEFHLIYRLKRCDITIMSLWCL